MRLNVGKPSGDVANDNTTPVPTATAATPYAQSFAPSLTSRSTGTLFFFKYTPRQSS